MFSRNHFQKNVFITSLFINEHNGEKHTCDSKIYFGIDLLLKLKYDTYLMTLKQYHSKLTMSLMSFFYGRTCQFTMCLYFFKFLHKLKKFQYNIPRLIYDFRVC